MKNLSNKHYQRSTLFIFFLSIALAMLVAIAPRAMAIDFVVANQMTLEWAATPPVNAGESIEYAIYIAPSDDKSSFTKLWQGPELEYTATFKTEGMFVFGIETYRIVDIGGAPTAVSNSAIGWSDDDKVAPNPFGVRHYLPPPMATGFKPK